MKIGFVQAVPRVASVKTQRAALIAAGVDERRIYGAGELKMCLEEMQPGETLCVWNIEVFAGKGRKKGPGSRSRIRDALTRALERGLIVYEVQPDRMVGQDPMQTMESIFDATDGRAGVSGRRARGRKPTVDIKDDAEKTRLAGIWKSGDYATNSDAAAAMGGKWTARKAHWHFGASGRPFGKKKQD